MRDFDDMVIGSKEEFDLLMANRDVLQLTKKNSKLTVIDMAKAVPIGMAFVFVKSI